MTSVASFAAADGTVTAVFVAGAWLGLSIAMPVGPTSLLCMSRTLLSGPATGLATGLAASLVHVVLSVVSVTAASHVVLPATGNTTRAMGIFAAIVLLGIAWRSVRSVAHPQACQPTGIVRSFASALAYCIGNPVTWLLVAIASPAALGPDHQGIPWLAAGIFAGSFGWWCCLTAVVAGFGRLLPPAVIPALRVISSAILSGFAALLIRRAFS